MQRVDCSGSSQPSSVCLLLWVPVCRWEDFFFVTTRTGSDQVYRYPNDACIAVAGDNGSLWLGVERPDRAAGPTLRQTVADGAATATLSNGALGIARFLGEASRPDSSWPCGKTVKCHQEVRTAQRNGSGMFSFAGVEVSKPGFERLDRLWRTIEERKAEGDWEGGSEAPRRNLVSPVSGAGPGCRSLLDRRFRADAHMRRVLTPFCALKRTARLLAKGPDKCAQKVGEEATEVCIEAAARRPGGVVKESADLLFHLLVLWASMGIEPKEVLEELARREGISGVEEKESRSR
ncbi:hisE [Symbiodinium microadriaticum]|nr:hisE [Symbiodinium microadriaticum]